MVPLPSGVLLSGDILLAVLLCTALGLALSFAPAKALRLSYVFLAATAFAAATLIEGITEPQARIAGAASIVITALFVHMPGGVRPSVAMLLSGNTGFWCGVLALLSPTPTPLLALPVALLALPGGWIASRRYSIVLKVLSGWVVAVAVLAAALPLITTPGYEPDHME